MLSFNPETGRIIAPARMVKRLGGDIDARGLPTDFAIPTTSITPGNFTNVVASTDDYLFSQKITRTGAGLARIHGPVINAQGQIRAYNIKALFRGGASTATSGETRCDVNVGFRSDNNQQGTSLEYIAADSAASLGIAEGTYLTGRASNSSTRNPVNFQINNAAENYAIDLWLTKTGTTGWRLSFGEGDGYIHQFADFTTSQLVMTDVRPYLQWNWTYATGTFNRRICQFICDIYFDF